MLPEDKKKEVLEKIKNLTTDDLLERFEEFGSEYIGPYKKDSNNKLNWNSKEIEPYVCPICGSKDLYLLYDTVEDGIYIEKYSCKDCKARFNNTFSIDFMGTELLATKGEE